MTGRVVDDEETVYRRIKEKAGEQLCYEIVGGKVFFKHAAFNDPQKRPSIDRAMLKSSPHLSRQSIEWGIIALNANAIRKQGPIAKRDEKGNPTPVGFVVDVVAEPEPTNCAHAVVALSDGAPNKAFMKLKESLVRLAQEQGWAVEPNSALPRQYGSRVKDAWRGLIFRIRHRF